MESNKEGKKNDTSIALELIITYSPGFRLFGVMNKNYLKIISSDFYEVKNLFLFTNKAAIKNYIVIIKSDIFRRTLINEMRGTARR